MFQTNETNSGLFIVSPYLVIDKLMTNTFVHIVIVISNQTGCKLFNNILRPIETPEEDTADIE